MKDLKIKVVKVKGTCPVYSNGDVIYLDQGYKLDLKRTDAVCMHSLASIIPYHNALSNGVKPEDLGLANTQGNGRSAYVQCLDPCGYTGGGTVIFEIETVE
jgi:uncharacterized repeat protein (TIGR04076 family)